MDRTHDIHAGLKRRAILLSIATAITLTTLKLIVAAVTGSLAVLSEVVHSLTDLLAASIAFFAVRTAAQPPDRTHRYGHHKMENLSAVIEGLLILVAIGWIVVKASQQLSTPHDITTPYVASLVMAGSAVVNYFVARHLHRIGQTTDSVAVSADGDHLMTDVYTSAGAAAGLAIVAATGYHQLDAIVAIGVGMFVIRTGLGLVIDGTRVLIDEGLPHDEVEKIEKAIEDTWPGSASYHRLRTRRSGSCRHIDLHLTLDGNLALWRAHEISHDVEKAIREQFEGLVDIVIHMEPHSVAPPPGEEIGPGDTH